MSNPHIAPAIENPAPDLPVMRKRMEAISDAVMRRRALALLNDAVPHRAPSQENPQQDAILDVPGAGPELWVKPVVEPVRHEWAEPDLWGEAE